MGSARGEILVASPASLRFTAAPAPRAIGLPMRIVFAASEMSPLAQTGGLGDAIEGLPATLAARGHDVSICLPCYRGLREDPALDVRSTGVELNVPIRDKRVPAEILECTAPNGVQLFLIR